MFDRTFIQQGDTQVYHTEKRAPTDESVRLLREMENSARSEVYKTIQLPSNDFKGIVHVMQEHLSCSTKFAILFDLNGTQHKVFVSVDNFRESTLEQKVAKIVTEVSDYLAGQILQKVFTAAQFAELRG
jgi:hypothetical protein